MTVGEIEYFGLPFRKDLFTRPFINDRVLDKLFGLHAPYVREHFLVARSYGLYDIKADYDTQKKVQKAFDGRTDENSLWIRDGLYRLISGVLFMEDPQQPEMYHPRIGVIGEPVFDALTAEEKDAFMRLYNNYYYQRHNFFWGGEAIRKITSVFGATRMLCCGEDLFLRLRFSRCQSRTGMSLLTWMLIRIVRLLQSQPMICRHCVFGGVRVLNVRSAIMYLCCRSRVGLQSSCRPIWLKR